MEIKRISPISPRLGKPPASPSSLFIDLGMAVKALRREADLTQKQLAERTGLHDTYISHIERGAGNPSFAALSRLCKGLEVPRWVLVKRVDELEQRR
jgi:transcriptional regulator with XRE-family HTH domain